MKAIVSYLFLILSLFFSGELLQAQQQITATLAGATISDGFLVEDNGNQPLLRVRGDGNVGIGTTSPNAILHTYATLSQNPPILERSFLGGNGHAELLNLSFTTLSGIAAFNDGGIVSFIGEDDGGNQEKYAEVVATIEDPTDGDEDGALSFRTLEGGTRTEQVRITSAGNVGIGTTTPSQDLEVESSGDTRIRVESTGSGAIVEIVKGNSSTAAAVNFFNGSDGVWGMGANGGDQDFYIQYDPDGTPVFRFFIETTGEVGINTTNPTAQLDINGTTGYDQLRMRDAYTPSSTSDTNGNIGDVAWDDDYIYIKTSEGWKRAALSTF